MRAHLRILSVLVLACSFGLALAAQGGHLAASPDGVGIGPVEGVCPPDGNEGGAMLRVPRPRPGRPASLRAPAPVPEPEAITNIDFVSHTRLGAPMNHCAAVDVTQKRIYGGFGTTFAVFSIADPTHPRLLSWLEMGGGYIYGIHFRGIGSSVYVAAGGAGILRVDVSNPIAPVVAAANPSITAIEATFFDDRLYVADANGYLQICDPITLAISYSVDLGLGGYGADEVFVLGDYAYVGCTAGFVVVDIAAATPVVVNQIAFTVEDPDWPPEVYGVFVQAQGAQTFAYLAVYDFGSTAPQATLLVVDVTNPLAPLSIVGSYTGSLGAGEDVVVTQSGSNFTAYVVDVTAGLRVLDVTNPTTSIPDLVAPYPSPAASGVALSGSAAYLSDSFAGILILDVSGATPTLTGTCEGTYYIRGVAATGRYVHHATYSGLKVVDVSIPGRPTTVGALPGYLTTAVRAPSAYGGRFLIGASGSSAQVVDAADPAAPVAYSSLPLDYPVLDLVVEGSYAYAAVGTSTVPGSFGLRVVDLADLSAPSSAGTYTPPSGQIRTLGVREGVVYLADYTGKRILVVDATTPTAPVLVTTEMTSGSPYAVCAHGDLLLVGGRQFVDIFDISDPRAPLWITKYASTSMIIRAIKMVGSMAYVATYDGLDVLDVSLPWAPVSVAQYEPGSVYGCSLDYDAGYIYLGTADSGGFMLHVTGSCNDRYEPNDDTVEAYTVQTGRLYDAWLCTAADMDYFRVAPGAGGTVSLTLQPPVGKNYDLLLYDGAQNLVASSLTAGDAVEHLSYATPLSGPFYALVRGSDGTQFSASATYSLTYTFTPCPAPTLPAYIYMGRRDINNNAVFDVQDPNQPATRTGYNLYRSDSPTGPFELIAGNMVDMDAGTANVQLVDVNSSTGGPYYYEIRDFNGTCGAEGP